MIMAGSEKKRDSEKVESTTLLHYAHISAGLPDTGTRPTGLVNLKAPMEVGWLAGVCQEEAAGTSRSGHREADKSRERIQRRQQFLLPLPPPRFLWCNLTPRGAPASRHTHRENQFQTCPAPTAASPPSVSVFSLLCFLVSFNS